MYSILGLTGKDCIAWLHKKTLVYNYACYKLTFIIIIGYLCSVFIKMSIKNEFMFVHDTLTNVNVYNLKW